jgi:hypothetical protein
MSELERFLNEIGVVDNYVEEPVVDVRAYYLVQGYYNDPRDTNGEVPF